MFSQGLSSTRFLGKTLGVRMLDHRIKALYELKL